MRAKVASVALVACGVFGLGAVAAPAMALEPASRDKHDKKHDKDHDGGGHDNGQQDNEYEYSCTSNDHAVVGNVCVILYELPILSDILSTKG